MKFGTNLCIWASGFCFGGAFCAGLEYEGRSMVILALGGTIHLLLAVAL